MANGEQSTEREREVTALKSSSERLLAFIVPTYATIYLYLSNETARISPIPPPPFPASVTCPSPQGVED